MFLEFVQILRVAAQCLMINFDFYEHPWDDFFKYRELRRGLFVGKSTSVATIFNQIEMKFIFNTKSLKIPTQERIWTQG